MHSCIENKQSYCVQILVIGFVENMYEEPISKTISHLHRFLDMQV